MTTVKLTCIECPIGCPLEADKEGDSVLAVRGNSCPRGKMYAESEVVCPKRVLTSTVRAASGEMIPVKTSAPVKRAELFALMKRLNAVHPTLPVKIGDVLVKDFFEGADLIASGSCEKE